MIEGFTAENWKYKILRHASEDSFEIDQNHSMISVADGVTRDPSVNLSKSSFVFKYPNPSPAKIAADTFTRSFNRVMLDFLAFNRDEKAIRLSFDEANLQIMDWNKHHISSPDYLTNDFAGCVAAGVLVKKNVVYYGFLTDCGVAVFDNDGELAFRTENQGPDKFDKEIWKDKRLVDLEWKDPRARRIVRHDYRNNPSEPNSFGVLTGEESAMNYVRTGFFEIKPTQRLLVYSDGLEKVIFSGKISQAIRNGDFSSIRKTCRSQVKTEGTLVYFSQ